MLLVGKVVFLVISKFVILVHAQSLNFECEDNQVLRPSKADYQCSNVTRINEDGERFNDTSVKCTCAWFENCKQHLKDDTNRNQTVYVNGVRRDRGKLFYKCCWSSRFNYDEQTCKNIGDVSLIGFVNDGANLTVIANVNEFEMNHLVCRAKVEDADVCLGIGTNWGAEDTGWVSALVVGLVVPLAVIQYCNPITTADITTLANYDVVYEPTTLIEGTVATFSCPSGSQFSSLPMTFVAECLSTGIWSFQSPTGNVIDSSAAPTCCLSQYTPCTTASTCCTATPVHTRREGECLKATDDNFYCNLGGINNPCTNAGSITDCRSRLVCSAGLICEKTCRKRNYPTGVTVSYTTSLNLIGRYALNTVATYTCDDGSHTIRFPSASSTCAMNATNHARFPNLVTGFGLYSYCCVETYGACTWRGNCCNPAKRCRLANDGSGKVCGLSTRGESCASNQDCRSGLTCSGSSCQRP